MAYIPETVRATALIKQLVDAGLTHLNSGKTGELFALERPDRLLMWKSDRISIFDFVLPALVRDKGSILTAMTILWLEKVFRNFQDHLIRYGTGIDVDLPVQLCNRPSIRQRAIVIKRMATPDIECIVRGYLAGTGLKAYQETQLVCGHHLPAGLHDGSPLPQAIFTPSTKAQVGHDEHIDYRSVRDTHGMVPELISLAVYRQAQEYGLTRGIIIADTKLELGQSGEIIDEVLTPDSSRFWLREEWEAAQANDPPSSPGGFDKEFVRRWGKTIPTPFTDGRGLPIVGIHKLKPENPDHVAFVSGLTVPPDVLEATSDLYRECLKRLFGETLESFWANV